MLWTLSCRKTFFLKKKPLISWGLKWYNSSDTIQCQAPHVSLTDQWWWLTWSPTNKQRRPEYFCRNSEGMWVWSDRDGSSEVSAGLPLEQLNPVDGSLGLCPGVGPSLSSIGSSPLFTRQQRMWHRFPEHGVLSELNPHPDRSCVGGAIPKQTQSLSRSRVWREDQDQDQTPAADTLSVLWPCDCHHMRKMKKAKKLQSQGLQLTVSEALNCEYK